MSSKPKKEKTLPAERKLEELSAKMQEERYMYQKYEKDSQITIPGTLFADFINVQGVGTQILQQVFSNITLAAKAIEMELAKRDVLTLQLMEQHMKNVDAGLTTTVPLSEIEGAEVAEELQATAEEPVKPAKALKTAVKKPTKK